MSPDAVQNRSLASGESRCSPGRRLGSDIPVSKPRYVRLLLLPSVNCLRCHKHGLVLFGILWAHGTAAGSLQVASDRANVLLWDPYTSLRTPHSPLCIYRRSEYPQNLSRPAPHRTSVPVLPQSIPLLNFHARIRMGFPVTTAVNIRTFPHFT